MKFVAGVVVGVLAVTATATARPEARTKVVYDGEIASFYDFNLVCLFGERTAPEPTVTCGSGRRGTHWVQFTYTHLRVGRYAGPTVLRVRRCCR